MLHGMHVLVGPGQHTFQYADKAHTLRVPLLDRRLDVTL